MGFSFPVEEVKEGRSLDLKSPVPDILAAYGELPYKVFAERLGSDRVCLSGPVRYSHLQNDGSRTAGLGSVEGAAESSIFILVASSIAREESLPLLEGAFKAAGTDPLLDALKGLPNAELRQLLDSCYALLASDECPKPVD